jgi:glc operon protein GlcG
MHSSLNLSHSDALKIIDTIRIEAEKANKNIAVAVADTHGELIAFLRTDGCMLAASNIAINKAFTAVRTRQPSEEIGEASRTQGFPMTNYGDPRFTAWGGGIPIFYQSQLVGAVGVSGLSEADDITLAALGVDSFMIMFSEKEV